jgi:D-alanyl-lipoteichoic acid acyltransferase DltB (MBOAT superfamily)
MIPNLAPIAPNGIIFIGLSAGLVLLAWSKWRGYFLPALTAAGILMAFSWLKPAEMLAALVFLIGPYIAARSVWGNGAARTKPLAAFVITLQIVLFLMVKQYAGFDLFTWLGNPITIVGISYILFRQIHLLLEAPLLGHLGLGIVEYLGYMLSPWTLIAGPIQNFEPFLDGLRHIGRPSNRQCLADGHRIANGLIKAFIISPLFLEPGDIHGLNAPGTGWRDFFTVLYGYPIYLYLNFSGYTDVMIGFARLCGFTTLPENFNRPYLSKNVQEFWARWHMSFGIWIKAYVFVPLSRRLLYIGGGKLQDLLLSIAVILTFVIVGGWHGPTSNFIAFGLLHGFAVILTMAWRGALRKFLGAGRLKSLDSNRWVGGFAIFLCFNYICATILLLNTPINELLNAVVTFISG